MHHRDLHSRQFRRRIGPERGHQFGHHRHPLAALHEQIDQRLAVQPVLPLQIIEVTGERPILALQFRRQLRHQHRRHPAVLVPRVSADQIPVRLFGAEHELLRPLAVHHRGDVLEPDQQIANAPHAVMLSDPPDQLRRHQCFDDVMVRRQRSGRFAFGQNMFGQHRADLVARERLPIPRGVIGHRSRRPDAVAIRIGRQHQIRPDRLGVLDRFVEHRGILRIGNVARHIGKITARLGVRAV